MKKIYIILFLLAIVSASCTRDGLRFRLITEDLESLNNKVSLDGDNKPTWTSGDMVMINQMEYDVSGGSVSDVEVASDGIYRVVYPSNIATSLTSNTNIPIILPRYQICEPQQSIKAAMVGYTADASSDIKMRNVGAIIKVKITNDLENEDDVEIDSVVLKTSICPLSGNGTIDDITRKQPSIIMSNSAAKVVSLHLSSSYYLENEDFKSYYIAIPPIPNPENRFAVEVYCTQNGERCRYAIWQTSGGRQINRSTLVRININLESALKTNLSEPDPAEPINPDAFCASIKEIANGGDTPGEVDTKIQHIVFNYSSETGEDIADGVKAQWDEGTGTMTISVAGSSMEIDDLGGMFQGMAALRDVDFGSGFNTASVSNVAGIFADCASLQRVNMSGLDLGAVTNMSYMFVNCESLTEVILPTSLATAHITDFSFMFSGCTQLGNVAMENALSRINTSYATTMAGMFAFCSGITSLNLSNMNTTSAVDMFMMLGGCTNIQTLNLGSQFRVGASHAMMCNQMGWNASQINITCTAEAEAALRSGTNLDLSKTIFNRP